MITPIRVFSGTDINTLNEELWRYIYTKGNDIKFGSVDEPKDAREIFAVIQVYGQALKDLYNGKLPKGWKFGEAANKIYIEMLKDPEKGEQPYTYGERLHHYPIWDGSRYENEIEDLYIIGKSHMEIGFDGFEYINQIETVRDALKESIESGIQSNRICGVIWNPADMNLKDPPCFQHFQARITEGNKVSLRIYFRSNDATNAVFANMGAVIRVFVDEVITPAGGILEEVIWTATSEHIYRNDFDTVEALVGKIPDHLRRLMR